MKKKNTPFSIWNIMLLLLIVIVFPMSPILISGDWTWIEAWAFVAVFIPGFIIGRVLAARNTPDIITERVKSMGMKDAKPWDKILAPIVAFGTIIVILVSGFDRLFGWSSIFNLWIRIVGLLLLIAGYVFSSWALIENKFFSGVVRIQSDRGHHVIDSGPYRILRHPGYTGAILVYISVPLLLDSAWAFIPAVLFCIALIIRTALEDKTLQAELKGYKEFTEKTKYRLFWGIW